MRARSTYLTNSAPACVSAPVSLSTMLGTSRGMITLVATRSCTNSCDAGLFCCNIFTAASPSLAESNKCPAYHVAFSERLLAADVALPANSITCLSSKSSSVISVASCAGVMGSPFSCSTNITRRGCGWFAAHCEDRPAYSSGFFAMKSASAVLYWSGNSCVISSRLCPPIKTWNILSGFSGSDF